MWILPTLNRPEQCKQVIERLKKHGCSTPGVVFVNTITDSATDLDAEADEEIEKKIASGFAAGMKSLYLSIDLPVGWEIILNDGNVGLCRAMNMVFSQHPNEPFYGLITDDEFICTDGWDKILSEAAGKWNVAHGNNGWQSHRRIHGFMTIGGELARTVGYLMPERLWHWFSDDVWEHIAMNGGLRRFCPEVRIENKHWMLGNAEKDKTYELSESRSKEDREVFLKWRGDHLQAIMERVWESMRIAYA